MNIKEIYREEFDKECKAVDPNSPLFDYHRILLNVIKRLAEKVNELEKRMEVDIGDGK